MKDEVEDKEGDKVEDKVGRTRKLKALLQNASLALATFLLCFVLLEVVLRFLGYGNLEVYQPDPVLYWRLKPNQQCFTKIGRKPVRVNSRGTRGPEFAPAKPPGTFRILSLGDSRTFGWGLAEGETYSMRLQPLLQAEVGTKTRIEVINAGVNAWSFQQMHVFLRDTALAWSPDLVLIGEANLWTQFSEHNHPGFVRKFMWRVRLKNLLRRSATYHYIVEVKLKRVYERYRTRFIPVDPRRDELFKDQQQSDPEAAFRDAISGLCRTSLEGGAKPVLLYLPTLDELTSTNPSSIRQVKIQAAAEFSAPFVTLPSPWQPGAPNGLYLEGDPVHFNASGNEWIARELFRAIAPLVKP